jgi:hypothetical protein
MWGFLSFLRTALERFPSSYIRRSGSGVSCGWRTLREDTALYDHYPDKFALLECMVASRFHELLAVRGVKFDDSCSSALKGIVLCVCDYLAGTPGMDCERQRQMEPHMESAVIRIMTGSGIRFGNWMEESYEDTPYGTPGDRLRRGPAGE